MDDYKLKRVLRAKKDDPDVRSSLTDNPAAWLNHKKIRNYSMVVGGRDSDFANARLTQLIDEALCNKAECLLWVPPSLPYYPLSGVYAESAGFSKTLVFSAWLMVPRMLASLISYEVERRTIGNRASIDPHEKDRRLYFAPDKKRHPVPQLVYRVDDKEPSNLKNFTLLYPSLTLAALFDPVAARIAGKSQAVIETELETQIVALVEKLQLRRYEQADGESDRWYWAGPLLLDKLGANHSSVAEEWLNSDDVHSTSFSTGEEAGDTSKGQHFDRLLQAFESPQRIGLGPMPDDFPKVMAEMALGSPAVIALRSFNRLYGGTTSASCVSALSVANEFVNLFNKPESVAAVRIAVQEQLQYWQKVLRYCRDGCLQAVLDEYLHLLKAECDTVTEAVVRLNRSINIRTGRLKVDDLGTFLRDEQKNMRCHFAVDFGNQRIETDEGSKRVASIRHSFNSPFRPFVLATTSIGQEGLDFHQYCRKVVHWNLPSNPIDLEQREGRINRFKGLVIRQQIAHKYGHGLTTSDVQSKDLWDDLFRIAEFMERDGKPYCQLVPYWHVETSESKQFKIERIIPFYPFSRDRAKLSLILRTLAIYRLAFGQPRQSELIEHLLKHLPVGKIGAVREKLMVNLSPISYQANRLAGVPTRDAEVNFQAPARGADDGVPSILHPQVPDRITNTIGMQFVWIPPGTFTMGSPKEEIERGNNETRHKVTLTKGFYLGVHLVTQLQWEAVMGSSPSRFKGEKALPVEGVSWEDCKEMTQKLRSKEKHEYRLPSEAEWEYACRAGTTTAFHFGGAISTNQANYDGTYAYQGGKRGVFRRQTTPVGCFPPNDFGLYDMHGNVYEWCQDWYGDAPENSVIDPQGPAVGRERVARGGCWGTGPSGCRSAYRRGFEANRRTEYFGFRLVLCPA